jgi:hypothetical protein
MSEMIIADGILYERVFPRYEGDYEPAPQPLESPQLGVQRVHYTKRPSASVRILEALEACPCTFTQLARHVRGSSQFCRAILEPMVADGRVVRWETAPRQGTRGRPQVMYRLSMRDL